MLTPAFHFNILQQFIPIFFDHANVLMKELKHHLEVEKGFDIMPHMIDYTLRTICGRF